MTLLLYLIGRLFVIAFALFLALIASALFIGFGVASGIFPEFLRSIGQYDVLDPETDRMIVAIISFVIGAIASFQLAGIALLPVTVAIATTEMMRWQSMSVHLVLGGLCALFVMFSALSLPPGSMPANGTLLVSMSAGFVGAFFYWLVAGRNAGEWLSPLYKQNPNSES